MIFSPKALAARIDLTCLRPDATVEDVRLTRQTVGERTRVKGSGSIRDLATLLAMIEAGADRIGASALVDILSEAT